LLDGAGAGPIALSDVKSIFVKVTKVQVLRADSARRDTVVTLNVTGGGKVNLLALPTKATDGLQLARGTLPAGTYSNLRLVFDSATITLNKDVTVGGGPQATTYKKDTAYPLTLSGGKGESSLKVPTGTFTVTKDAGATVSVAFSGGESVRKVIVTPQEIRMTPVLTAEGKGKRK
ncbi:MAG: DUF4382 domain-containing protein, partial [Gemmatimonadota bacterium]|nr:DUF4382 domain-containing protein [Gemmatimonadota bacterium]